jgi:hypothetical protein
MAQQGTTDVRTSSALFWWACAVLAVVIVLLHFPALTRPVVDPDEATAAVLAREMLDGGRLYVDVVDRKPPGMQYLYAMSFQATGSESLVPLRFLMFLAQGATAVVIAVTLVRSRWERFVTVALFMFGTATLPLVDAHSASAEGFMVLPVTLAWWCSRRSRPFLAGLLLAAAVLIKQPAVFAALPIVFNLWRRPDGPRLVAIGGIAFSALYLVAGSLFGLRDFVFWNVSGNSAYLFSQPLIGILATGIGTVALFALGHIVLLGLTGRAWTDRRTHPDLWLWLIAASAGVIVGQRFWGHYFLQLLPPLTALAATQLHRFSLRKITAAAVVTTLVPFAVFTALPQPNLPSYERVVAEIEARSGPDDALFIWGTFPEVYWASGRPMATRFPHTNFVTGVNQAGPTEGTVADLCRDLDRSQPMLVLDMAPAGLRAADEAPIDRWPEMRSVLGGYTPVAEIDGAVLYERTEPWIGCPQST